jgi:hypothetical protein
MIASSTEDMALEAILCRRSGTHRRQGHTLRRAVVLNLMTNSTSRRSKQAVAQSAS